MGVNKIVAYGACTPKLFFIFTTMIKIRDAKFKDDEIEKLFRDKKAELISKNFYNNIKVENVFYHILRDYINLMGKQKT